MSNTFCALPSSTNLPAQRSCGALAVELCPAPVSAVRQPSTPPVGAEPEKLIPASPAPQPSARCSVKGCVFPAPSPGNTTCRYHELLQSEAALFQSHQPSHALLLHAPFGIAEDEIDDSRYRDRERQAAERTAFQLDEPPAGLSLSGQEDR